MTSKTPYKMIEVTCAACGATFERGASYVKSRMQWGQKRFYCNARCQRSMRMIPWSAELNDKQGGEV